MKTKKMIVLLLPEDTLYEGFFNESMFAHLSDKPQDIAALANSISVIMIQQGMRNIKEIKDLGLELDLSEIKKETPQ